MSSSHLYSANSIGAYCAERERERINYLFMCEEIGSEGLKEGSSLPPQHHIIPERKTKNKTKNSNCISFLMQTVLFLEFHIQAVS